MRRRYHGGVNTTACSREAPQRRQNFRMGSLPSPHCPQTLSPGLMTLSEGCFGLAAGRALAAAGFTASGWTGATGPVAEG